ncbi:MAG: carboxypeptidase-like regulatory domain-containing protein [Gemmatimonadetes bacterium]|nr:carboxypeptidase-like regulatory domain-containing protein [Gemmatimonadota bacterium]
MTYRALLSSLFFSTAAAAQGTAPRVVVHDSAGTPIPFVNVQVGGGKVRAASDSGIALLSVQRAESLKIIARRIGFDPVERWVHADSAGEYHLVMRASPQFVGRAVIYARNTPLARAGFYDRMERSEHGAIGARFLTPEAIELRNANRVSSLLEGESTLRVRTVAGKPVLSGRGGNCPVGLIVDGQRMLGTVEEMGTTEGQIEIERIMRRLGSRPDARDAAEREYLQTRSSIDEIVTSLAVAAIEIYPSVSSAPAELQRNAAHFACSLVVVWTGRR